MEGDTNGPIRQLRASNREDLSVFRRKEREELLRQKRLRLSEVEALISKVTLEQYTELVFKMKKEKPSLDLLKAIKNNCCTPGRSEVFFRTEGAFNSLVRVLVGNNAQLQLEAVACLTNLVCGSHKASQRVAKRTGAYLVSFISGGSCYLQDQCAWVAGNISNDCFECFSLLKAQGLLPSLLAALKSPSTYVITSSVFALRACTKYGDPDLMELVKPSTTSSLLKIIKESLHENTVSDAAFTLANICYLAVQNNADVMVSDVELILTCLSEAVSGSEINILVTLPLVRCLGFLSSRDLVCQYFLSCPNFYDSLKQIFKSDCLHLKREFLWVLTNIMVYKDIDVIDDNLMLQVLEKCLHPTDISTLQVLYFLCTVVSKNEKVCSLFCREEITLKLNPLLVCGEKSVETVAQTFLDILKDKCT